MGSSYNQLSLNYIVTIQGAVTTGEKVPNRKYTIYHGFLNTLLCDNDEKYLTLNMVYTLDMFVKTLSCL